MTSPRRIALFLIAAGMVVSVAPSVHAQSGGGRGGAQNPDDDDDDEDAPPPPRNNPPPAQNNNASPPPANNPPPAASNPPPAANNPPPAATRPPPAAGDDDDDEPPPARNNGNGNGSGTAPGGSGNGTVGPLAPGASAGAAMANTPAARANVDEDWPPPGETELQARERRERMLPRYSSIDGSTGLLHVSTAEAGNDMTFRFGLIAEAFGQGGFLNPVNTRYPNSSPYLDSGMTNGMQGTQDSSRHIGATLTLAVSPIRYLEIFAALRSYANYDDGERPNLFQVLGDSTLGIKGIYPVLRGVRIGVSLAGVLLNPAGDIGLSLASTSMNARLMGTFDLNQITNGSVPVRIHINGSYYLDNSAALVQSVEQRRRNARLIQDGNDVNNDGVPDCDTADRDPSSGYNRNRACHVEISRFERYALGINRLDRINLGIGVDVLLPYIRPFVEYNIAIPVNRQGYVCYDTQVNPYDTDRCLASSMNPARETSYASAIPHTVTLGARVLPPIRGLSGLLAVDIATGGSSEFVRDIAPIAPWMVYFGASFATDFAPEIRERDVERIVRQEVRVDQSPIRGGVIGTITDAETHQPVPGAIIDFVGHGDFGLAASDAQGRYHTREVTPAQYQLHVHATDYNDNTCDATIPAPQGESRNVPDTTVDCALRPMPRAGTIAGRVTNGTTHAGMGGVAVTLAPVAPAAGAPAPSGPAPTSQTVQTGPDGSYQVPNVIAGQYTVAAAQTATTRASTPRALEVRPRETANGDIEVAAVDTRGIAITRGAISVREQIHFQTDSAEILPDSQTLLERIADFMQRHPEAARIEIQGHTDNQGALAHNTQLSQSRAESVRQRLIELGVSGDRLAAHGYGPTRPIAPNITPGGRARNRRVMFVITERAGGAAGGGGHAAPRPRPRNRLAPH